MGAMRPVDLEDDTQLPTNLQGHTLWVDRAKDGVRGKQGSVRMLELEFEIELNIWLFSSWPPEPVCEQHRGGPAPDRGQQPAYSHSPMWLWQRDVSGTTQNTNMKLILGKLILIQLPALIKEWMVCLN